jgi:hypothetical protein
MPIATDRPDGHRAQQVGHKLRQWLGNGFNVRQTDAKRISRKLRGGYFIEYYHTVE